MLEHMDEDLQLCAKYEMIPGLFHDTYFLS